MQRRLTSVPHKEDCDNEADMKHSIDLARVAILVSRMLRHAKPTTSAWKFKSILRFQLLGDQSASSKHLEVLCSGPNSGLGEG
jgi:hypothetical protein